MTTPILWARPAGPAECPKINHKSPVLTPRCCSPAWDCVCGSWVHGQLTWEFSHLVPLSLVPGLLICFAFHGTSESRNYWQDLPPVPRHPSLALWGGGWETIYEELLEALVYLFALICICYFNDLMHPFRLWTRWLHSDIYIYTYIYIYMGGHNVL